MNRALNIQSSPLVLKDRLKNLLGGNAPAQSAAPGAASSARILADQKPIKRQSSGMEQFFSSMRDQQGLSILDFAGASQSNISFITGMGHRISSEDYVRSLELAFGHDYYEAQNDTELVDEFMKNNLSFPNESFDGALVWDSLEFLSPTVLQQTIDRLYDVLRPGSSLLVFFHASEKAIEVPIYQYRIEDQKTLLLTPRGVRKQIHFFNNRALEKLFAKFQSVKFFLTRDSLREIIVRR